MRKRIALQIVFLLCYFCTTTGQQVTIAGHVVDEQSRQPIEFASILMKENGHWAITDANGQFVMRGVPTGKAVLTVQCLGYATRSIPLNVTGDMPRLTLKIKQQSLKLEEVTVTAHRKTDEATTSYTIDRTALDNQQILNIGDVQTLLPGGKTVNATLMDDSRIALRSNTQEKGNASFGTAIEVDGVRMDNNAATGETMAASTRTISAANVESVEIVTGIPSVEYGDLSNGVVKVNTRRGKSPFIVEGKINQHTRQIALNKGLDLGHQRGVLNVALEHARSFSDAASPYTAYQRNILTLNYMNTFFRQSTPLTLNIGVTGNVGGYNSEADPDEELDDYTKIRDNSLVAHINLNWLLNKPWLTNLSVKGSLSFADKRAENYYHTSSASSQPYLHTTEEGYHIAQPFPSTTGEESVIPDIVLGPTGYWYVTQFTDSKPLSYALKAKGDWTRRFGPVLSRLLVGADYTGSRNLGRGVYYDDLSIAPTWREYRYDRLPATNNLALYAEEKVTLSTSRFASVEMTAGLRDDITLICGSDYGTVSSLSPRFNARYIFWRNQYKRIVSSLMIHAGWGKSVKLPSYQVLYPTPSYSDVLAFTPGSTADNRAYYAYYTYPQKAIHNPNLRWQYTHQTDLGIEATILGTRISLSAFYHKTFNPYMAVNRYTPYTYKSTGQSAIERSGIAIENRNYDIDPLTGVVTLSDLSGATSPQHLAYTEQRTYNTNHMYVNGSAVKRYGLEWVVDFAQIKALHTSLRFDGNYYRYKGTDETLFAANQSGSGSSSNTAYPLLGYYVGSSSNSTGTVATASVANGSESKQVNLNTTLTTHIPRIRLIVSLRLEYSLYNYRRSLCELSNGSRGVTLEDVTDYFGTAYDASVRDKYVAVYPKYYSTWDDPTTLIPFAEKLEWAKDNDQALYNQLARLVVKSNYPYTLNPNRLSSYYSANFTVTKEIGDHVSVSFYANNFFRNMKTVHSSQTDLETSLFGSGYIPSYYYGLSMRLKI